MQVTFFHSVVGIPIRPDDLHFVARMGTEEGTGVEVAPSSIFKATSAIHVPNLLDFIKVETPDDFEKVEADQSKARKKLKVYGVLIPSLGRAVLASNKTPSGTFTNSTGGRRPADRR